MIEKILVPLDGSRLAEAVLPFVSEVAAKTEAEVLLVSAVSPLAVWDEAHATVELEAEEASAGDYVNAERDDLTRGGLTVRSRVSFGAPAEVILWTAEDEDANLIAMTTRGRSGVARWVLGGVADKVLHATHTPLLLVRPPSASEQRASALTRLLVPLDGSELSAAVLPFAFDLAKALGAAILLYQSVPDPIFEYPGMETVLHPAVLESMKHAAREYLTKTASALTHKGVETDTIVTVATATEGIVSTAEREDAGLIVMSTRGRSGIGRAVLGSVADSVVRRTELPVVVVRPDQSQA